VAWKRNPVGLCLTVAGAVMVVGSVLRWLTVTGELTGNFPLMTASGLHDLGYKSTTLVGLGAMTLVAGVVVLTAGLMRLLDRRFETLSVAAVLASGVALLIVISAGVSIIRHQAARPRGANVDFSTGVGVWITAIGAAAGLVGAAMVLVQARSRPAADGRGVGRRDTAESRAD
jgi:hypothetical protein